ncbi:hypothetical protein IWZ03DRAFT_43783 [Phyllosticta citriasiana]|uniref:Uncharacterized protein n=1 Tax=Phyllosticta citriasiana TaxID=595635 RepID=A0ABR1KE20_9PEZI
MWNEWGDERHVKNCHKIAQHQRERERDKKGEVEESNEAGRIEAQDLLLLYLPTHMYVPTIHPISCSPAVRRRPPAPARAACRYGTAGGQPVHAFQPRKRQQGRIASEYGKRRVWVVPRNAELEGEERWKGKKAALNARRDGFFSELKVDEEEERKTKDETAPNQEKGQGEIAGKDRTKTPRDQPLPPSRMPCRSGKNQREKEREKKFSVGMDRIRQFWMCTSGKRAAR